MSRRPNARAEALPVEDDAPTDLPTAGTPGRRRGPHLRLTPREPDELRGGLWYCLKVFLALRVGLSLLGVAALGLLPHFPLQVNPLPGLGDVPGPVPVPGWPAAAVTPGWHNLVTAFERFDALWFLRIASHGYARADGSAAFYPLYPLATRAASFILGGHPLAGALVVSNAAFLGALMMLFVLARAEIGDERARRTVLYLALFPTSFFFLAPYSEALFLLLVLVCLWGARRRRWWMAAAAGALAAATRNFGALLILPVAVEAVQQHRRDDAPLLAPLLWSAGPASGTGAYFLYWRLKAHDLLYPVHQQANWERHLADPLVTLWRGTRYAFGYPGSYAIGYHSLDWLVVAPVLVLGVYGLWKLRPLYSAYLWASVLAPLAYVFDGRPLMSMPRFAAVLFPVPWALALWTGRSRGRREAAVALSSGMLVLLFVLFANWLYVF